MSGLVFVSSREVQPYTLDQEREKVTQVARLVACLYRDLLIEETLGPSLAATD